NAHYFLSSDHSRLACLCDGSARNGAPGSGDGKIKDGCKPAPIPKRILEIPFGDRSFRPRQFQQFIFDFADTGYWRPLGDDDLDVCSVQPCRRTHFVSRGLLLRQMGKKKCPARLVYHFCAHLYWLRQCTERPNFRCTVYLLRSISGIFRSVGKAFASDFVPENLRASGVGWYSSTVGLLELVASVVAGPLWDRVGHAAVFYYGAIFGLAGSIGLIVLTPKRDHPSAA